MDIWRAALDKDEYVIRCRRWFHENAELSDMEEKTVAYILQQLQDAGIACVDVPKGGVMGFIYGKKPGKTILLRADIDALPMQEDPWNEKQPKVCVSKNDGVAHCCGHDTHAAMLLGAARILHEHRDVFEGRIVLYFERGEEHGHGDYYMTKYIQDNSIHIDGCWAMHNKPFIPTGSIAIFPGPTYGGSTSWGASILGENSLACAVAIVNSLNTARMRTVIPYEATTLASTKLQFGTDKVTVPGACQIAGNCRYYDMDKAGRPMRDVIYETIDKTCAAYGCTLARPLKKGNMSWPCINDPTAAKIASDAVGAVIGADKVVSHEPAMGHESYSILAAYYPSVMATLGVGNKEKGQTATAHNPKYDPDEDGLKVGVASTVAYAMAFLAYEKPIPFQPFQGTVDDFMYPQ